MLGNRAIQQCLLLLGSDRNRHVKHIVYHHFNNYLYQPKFPFTPGYEAENLLKPPECVAASAGIAPKEASEVAAAIVNGIERERKIITADRTTAALAKGGAPMLAIAERQMAAQVRKVATRH